MAEPYPVEVDDQIIIVKRKNLDILLKKSIEKAKNAVKSSCYSSLKECTRNEIDNLIKRKNNKLKIVVYNNILDLIKKMNHLSDNKKLY